MPGTVKKHKRPIQSKPTCTQTSPKTTAVCPYDDCEKVLPEWDLVTHIIKEHTASTPIAVYNDDPQPAKKHRQTVRHLFNKYTHVRLTKRRGFRSTLKSTKVSKHNSNVLIFKIVKGS